MPPTGINQTWASRRVVAPAILLWLISFSVLALDAMQLPAGETNGIELTPYLRYTSSLAEDATLAEALETPSTEWLPLTDTTPNFGLTRKPHWFEMALQSDSARRLFVEVSYALLNQVDVYFLHNNELSSSFSTGNAKPFASRPVDHRNYVFPVDVAAGQTIRVFLRVKTDGALQVPVLLWDQVSFWKADQNSLTAHSIFAAVMLTVAVINFLLFFGSRDLVFLHYSLYVLMIALAQLGLRGMNYQFLWPDSSRWNEYSLLAFMGGAIAFGALFANRFLKIRQRSRPLYHSSVALVYLGLATAVSVFFLEYSTAIALAIPLAAFACLLMLLFGIVIWGKGHKPGGYYTVAWSFFLMGMFSTLLAKLGLIPRSDFIEYGPEFGAALEVIMLTFGITDRMNDERRLRISMQDIALENAEKARKAQEESLAREHQANLELEANVEMRIQELKYALGELSAANAKLQDLSTLDGLTQLRNRRYFDEAFRREWERAARDKSELSLMILDADFFKLINDNFGHIAGDDCLKALARILETHIKRPADTLVRYGGEEFVVILPGTDNHGVLRLAENIRIDVEYHPMDFEGRGIQLTVSIGAAYCACVAQHEPADLFTLADKALYEAKESGRNRVVIRELV
jgi:diguanylate cyclase (GGDEF)-like protein